MWNIGCTQSLVISCKYWVIPLISTGVSGYSQVILLVTNCAKIIQQYVIPVEVVAMNVKCNSFIQLHIKHFLKMTYEIIAKIP